MRHSRPQLLANTYYFQYRSKYKKTLQFFAAITVSRLNRDISIIECRCGSGFTAAQRVPAPTEILPF